MGYIILFIKLIVTMDNEFSPSCLQNLHKDFQPIIASSLMKNYLELIEKNKKDVTAINSAFKLMSYDTILPSFSGDKRKEWIKKLKKAKKKLKKKTKKNNKKLIKITINFT